MKANNRCIKWVVRNKKKKKKKVIPVETIEEMSYDDFMKISKKRKKH